MTKPLNVVEMQLRLCELERWNAEYAVEIRKLAAQKAALLTACKLFLNRVEMTWADTIRTAQETVALVEMNK